MAQMIRQMYEVLPISAFGLMWSVVPVDYDRPRRVIIQQKTEGSADVNPKVYSVWANEALCKLLHSGQDPNNSLPERYLITGGSDAGRFVKREDISNSQHLPSSFKLISDKHETSIKNAIDLDANAIPPPDAESQFQRFLVSCDFIQDRIVGGFRTGLLNVTPNPGMTLQHNTTSFSTESISPLYYPVKDLTFQSFTFRVRDDYGDYIDLAGVSQVWSFTLGDVPDSISYKNAFFTCVFISFVSSWLEHLWSTYEKIDLFSNAVSGNGHVNTCDNFVNMLPEPCNMQMLKCVWNKSPFQHHGIQFRISAATPHVFAGSWNSVAKWWTFSLGKKWPLIKTPNGLAKDITALYSLSNQAFTTRQEWSRWRLRLTWRSLPKNPAGRRGCTKHMMIRHNEF